MHKNPFNRVRMVRQAHHERDCNIFIAVRPELVEGNERVIYLFWLLAILNTNFEP